MSDAHGRIWTSDVDSTHRYYTVALSDGNGYVHEYVRADVEAMEAAGWCSLANAQSIAREQAAKIESLSQQLQEARAESDKAIVMLKAALDKAADERDVLRKQLEAAERLCQIYFEIAELVMHEDEIRARRDKALQESSDE